MNIVDELNNEFSKQKSLYKVGQQPVAELEKYKQIAMGYAEMENAVSVLSDMHTNVSYVYYGRFSQVFGWYTGCFMFLLLWVVICGWHYACILHGYSAFPARAG